MFNDTISDLLTRIRNASIARRPAVIMPYAKMSQKVAEILRDNGYLTEVATTTAGPRKMLQLTLPQDPETITALVRVSKPGRRVYTGAKDIPLVLGGRGLVIVSTSSGIMTGREARRKNLGGELICKVW